MSGRAACGGRRGGRGGARSHLAHEEVARVDADDGDGAREQGELLEVEVAAEPRLRREGVEEEEDLRRRHVRRQQRLRERVAVALGAGGAPLLAAVRSIASRAPSPSLGSPHRTTRAASSAPSHPNRAAAPPRRVAAAAASAAAAGVGAAAIAASSTPSPPASACARAIASTRREPARAIGGIRHVRIGEEEDEARLHTHRVAAARAGDEEAGGAEEVAGVAHEELAPHELGGRTGEEERHRHRLLSGGEEHLTRLERGGGGGVRQLLELIVVESLEPAGAGAAVVARRGGLEGLELLEGLVDGQLRTAARCTPPPSALSEMKVDDFAFDSLCGTLRSFDGDLVFARGGAGDSAASISGGCWSHWNSSIFSSNAPQRRAAVGAERVERRCLIALERLRERRCRVCARAYLAASGKAAERRERASSAYVTTARYPSDVATTTRCARHTTRGRERR